MTEIKWRVWYANGQVLDSRTTAWSDLPREGLVIAKAWEPTRKVLACGADAIVFDPEQDPCLIGVNLPTDALRVAAELDADAGRLKYGVRLPDDDYARLYEAALASRWE